MNWHEEIPRNLPLKRGVPVRGLSLVGKALAGVYLGLDYEAPDGEGAVNLVSIAQMGHVSHANAQVVGTYIDLGDPQGFAYGLLLIGESRNPNHSLMFNPPTSDWMHRWSMGNTTDADRVGVAMALRKLAP